jgi:hypothetical protein
MRYERVGTDARGASDPRRLVFVDVDRDVRFGQELYDPGHSRTAELSSDVIEVIVSRHGPDNF